MKRNILSFAFVLFAGFACVAQEVPKDTKPADKAPDKVAPCIAVPSVTIDMNKKVPNTLELFMGQEVVFENGNGNFKAAETDGKGELLSTRPHNTNNQGARYMAMRVGEGEIKVQTSSQGLLTVARQYTIKVKVVPLPAVPAPPAAKSFDLYGNHPQTIDLKVGDDLTFWYDTNKQYIVARGISQATTDGKAGNVLDVQATATVIDANGHSKVAVYKAKRAGTAEVTIQLDRSKGATGPTRVIKINVK